MTDDELAEYLYLEGKLLSRIGEFASAAQRFEQAHRTAPARDAYLVASIESQFAAQPSAGPEFVESMLNRLEGMTSTAAASLRNRLLTVCADYEGAQRELDLLPPIERAIPTAVHFFYRSAFSEAIEVCTTALTDATRAPRDRALLLVLRARCRWHLTIGPFPLDDELPLYGPPGVDSVAWKEAWTDIESALPILRDLRWPINGDLYADVVTSVALTLGHGKELYPFLANAAESLPWSSGIQRTHETLCMVLGRFDDALLANSRLEKTPSNVARRVTLLQQAEDMQGCVAVIEENLDLIFEAAHLTPISIGMGATAASKTNRPLLVKSLLSYLEANPAWTEYAAFFRTAIDCQRRGRDARQWTNALKSLRNEHPNSVFIAQNLLAHLDPNQPDEASTLLGTVAHLRTVHEINFGDTQKSVRACLTLKHWDDALREVDDAIERFGPATRLVAMRAIALDNSGKTAAALAQFQDGIAASDAASELLHAYLGLCLRLSMYDAAQSAITGLLGRAHNADDIVELKRLNLLVAAQSGLPQNEYFELLRDFAATVNSDDAEQEATYLSIIAHAQYVRGMKLPGELIGEFRARSNLYSSKFPDSKNFVVLTTPENPAPDEFLKSLEPLLGDWHVKGREYLRRERELKAGQLPVPYITRAGYALHYVGDPLTLWEASKSVSPDMRQFHMTMKLSPCVDHPLTNFSRPPTVDITALMVLESLGLLETLFLVWPIIVIGQRSVAYLSQLASSPLESSRGYATAKRLLHFIQANLTRIEQPRVELAAHPATLQPVHLVQEAEALHRVGHPLLADDAVLRTWCRELSGIKNSFCSLDVLRWAEEAGKLPLETVCQAYVQLCNWNVGIAVPLNVFLAPLLDDSWSAGSLESIASSLRKNGEFETLSRAVWWPDKDYAQMLGHIRAVLIGLASRENTSAELIAAVWSAWLAKVQFASDGAGQKANRAASMFFLALQPGDAPLPKIWTAFKLTVQLEYGDRMDKEKEREAIQAAATFANKLALDEPTKNVAHIVRRLQDCITTGTEEAQWFSDALLRSIDGLNERDRHRVSAILDGISNPSNRS